MNLAPVLFIFILFYWCELCDCRIDHAIGERKKQMTITKAKTCLFSGVLYEEGREDARETLECGARINNYRPDQETFFNPNAKSLTKSDSFDSSKISNCLK